MCLARLTCSMLPKTDPASEIPIIRPANPTATSGRASQMAEQDPVLTKSDKPSTSRDILRGILQLELHRQHRVLHRQSNSHTHQDLESVNVLDGRPVLDRVEQSATQGKENWTGDDDPLESTEFGDNAR